MVYLENKVYEISKVIVLAIVLMLELITTFNQDESIKVAFILMFIVMAVTSLNFDINICKDIIEKGNNKESLLSKSLYYTKQLIIFLLGAGIVMRVFNIIVNYTFTTFDININIICTFMMLSLGVLIITPYIHILVILLLRKMINK